MGRLQFNPKRKKCWQLIGWSGKIEASLSFEVCSSSSWRWSGTTLSFEHLQILRCWWGWSGLICCCWGQPSPRIFLHLAGATWTDGVVTPEMRPKTLVATAVVCWNDRLRLVGYLHPGSNSGDYDIPAPLLSPQNACRALLMVLSLMHL